MKSTKSIAQKNQMRLVLSLSLIAVLGVDYAHLTTFASKSSRFPAANAAAAPATPAVTADAAAKAAADELEASAKTETPGRTGRTAAPAPSAGKPAPTPAAAPAVVAAPKPAVEKDEEGDEDDEATPAATERATPAREATTASGSAPRTLKNFVLNNGKKADVTIVQMPSNKDKVVVLVQGQEVIKNAEGDICTTCGIETIIMSASQAENVADFKAIVSATQVKAKDEETKPATASNDDKDEDEEDDKFLAAAKARREKHDKAVKVEERRLNGILKLCTETNRNDEEVLKLSCATSEYLELLKDTPKMTPEAQEVFQSFYETHIETAIIASLATIKPGPNVNPTNNEGYKTLLQIYSKAPASKANWLRQRVLAITTGFMEQKVVDMRTSAATYQTATTVQDKLQARQEVLQMQQQLGYLDMSLGQDLKTSGQKAVSTNNITASAFATEYRQGYTVPLSYLNQSSTLLMQSLTDAQKPVSAQSTPGTFSNPYGTPTGAVDQFGVPVLSNTTNPPQAQPNMVGIGTPNVGIPQAQTIDQSRLREMSQPGQQAPGRLANPGMLFRQ
ncbi:MAG: hypothetical protein V4736_12810 [Bdellovibrionota bacterium]